MTVRYEIHPSIGVARVGSSRSAGEAGWFLGPEPGGFRPERYRDSHGDLRRQAARFRVFRCERDPAGTLQAATEVTPGAVRSLRWTVHLANRKATCPRIYHSGPGRRNRATGDAEQDRDLVIDAGARTVSRPGERLLLDQGRFRSTPVPLGELLVDAEGRLVVLGGWGVAGADPPQDRLSPTTGHRADNNDWFDDTADGPVTADLELEDGTTARASAWVLTAPPDFAPGIFNQVTLHDVLFDLAVRRGLRLGPADGGRRPHFERDIRPILERGMNYRWVNRAAFHGRGGDRATGHGAGGRGDFGAAWAALGDPSPRTEALRQGIFGRLRNPAADAPLPACDPLLYIPRLTASMVRWTGPENVLPLTGVQYRTLQAWATGQFEPGPIDPSAADPAELLPDALTRVALDACVGGALYPGIEASGQVLLDPTRFVPGEPFRLDPSRVEPGAVTAANAVPWQADFQACHWEEHHGPWPKRLAWWPAQRPDDVFVGPADAADPPMVEWTRGLGDELDDMVQRWDRLGFVTDQGTTATPFFAESERDVDALGP